MTILSTDNFDSDTVGSIAPGWTAESGTWVVGTVNPISTPNSFGCTSGDGMVALQTTNAANTTLGLQYDQKVTSVGSTAIPLVSPVLLANTGYSNAFAALLGHNASVLGGIDVNLYSRNGGSYSQVGAVTDVITVVQGDILHIRATITGTAIAIYLWKNSNTPPSTPSASFTSGAVTAAGYAGLFNGLDSASSASMAVDNVVIDNVGGAPAGSGGGTTTIALPNANVYASPYNWDSLAVGALGAAATCLMTTAVGAYLKTVFSGSTTFAINLDTSTYGSVPTGSLLITARLDDGAQEVTLPVQQATALHTFFTGLTTGSHTVEVYLSGSTEATGTRWAASGTSPTSCLRVAGIALDTGGTLSAPTLRPKRALFDGDSIMEAVRAAGTTTEPADHGKSLPWFLAAALNAEYGVVGYGATGWTVSGSGGMPPFPTYWNQYTAGRPRNFTPPPDYVFIFHGQNDGNITAVTTAAVALLPLMRTAFPSALIFVAPTPAKVAMAQLQNAVTQYRASAPGDKKVFFADWTPYYKTGGFTGVVATPTAQSVDGVHPLERENGKWSEAVMRVVLPVITKTRYFGVGGVWN